MQTEVLDVADMAKGAQTEEKMQKVWIKYLIHVTAMISHSASRKLRWYISRHLTRTGTQSVNTLPKLAQLRWAGHATRMLDERLPKKILYGELQVEKHSHGGQKK